MEYLSKDAKDPKSQNDFGKNIIPTMLNQKEKMMAYPFKGYWKDVGTIKSLWEANQDLIGEHPNFDIYNPIWKIYSRNTGIDPEYIAKGAVVSNSLVAGGTEIYGTVKNSIIGSKVIVEPGAVVSDSVVFAGSHIQKGAIVNYSILDENVEIGENAKVGEPISKETSISVVGRNIKINKDQVVPAGANLDESQED
jgi:glucose-1-phosphate adenylyltransferase